MSYLRQLGKPPPGCQIVVNFNERTGGHDVAYESIYDGSTTRVWQERVQKPKKNVKSEPEPNGKIDYENMTESEVKKIKRDRYKANVKARKHAEWLKAKEAEKEEAKEAKDAEKAET